MKRLTFPYCTHQCLPAPAIRTHYCYPHTLLSSPAVIRTHYCYTHKKNSRTIYLLCLTSVHPIVIRTHLCPPAPAIHTHYCYLYTILSSPAVIRTNKNPHTILYIYTWLAVSIYISYPSLNFIELLFCFDRISREFIVTQYRPNSGGNTHFRNSSSTSTYIIPVKMVNQDQLHSVHHTIQGNLMKGTRILRTPFFIRGRS